MNQWQVAALQPPHLAAICIWEGAADYYRDLSHHGGILCTFGRAWFPSQVIRVQHGRGTRGYRSRMTGDWVSGPATLTEEELGGEAARLLRGLPGAIRSPATSTGARACPTGRR